MQRPVSELQNHIRRCVLAGKRYKCRCCCLVFRHGQAGCCCSTPLSPILTLLALCASPAMQAAHIQPLGGR